MAKNSILDYERIANTIRNREFVPVYLLQGEEPYYIDSLSNLIEETVLKPEEKGFNQTIFYGKDVTANDIVMAAKRFPMMSEYQLILVKEAQNIKKEQWELFNPYLENPLKSTILVFCFKDKKMDQRTKTSKLFGKYSIFNSERLYDNQLPSWIEKYIQKKKKNIDFQATQLIADNLGNDLNKVANEIDKMLLQLPPQVEIINAKHIEDCIGISKDFNVFELQNALGAKNYKKSMQIALHFAKESSSNPITLTIASLSVYFNKILLLHTTPTANTRDQAALLGVNEFFLKDYRLAASNYTIEKIEKVLGLLKFYDYRSKGISGYTQTNDGELTKELISKILNQ
jgi:DNA polymerase-3 subunit delta